MAGLVIPKNGHFIEEVAPKVELIIVEFFLPLFFANSGLKTQIGSLNSAYYVGSCIAIIFIACAAKFIPACLATKFMRPDKDWKFAATMGFLMNTRGLVELIALNIGLQLKILSPRLFTMFVIMALITTFTTSPMLYYLYQKDHPEAVDPEPKSIAFLGTSQKVINVQNAANGTENERAKITETQNASELHDVVVKQ
jgi:Kef-type K+ transport system membrane component KefB